MVSPDCNKIRQASRELPGICDNRGNNALVEIAFVRYVLVEYEPLCSAPSAPPYSSVSRSGKVITTLAPPSGRLLNAIAPRSSTRLMLSNSSKPK